MATVLVTGTSSGFGRLTALEFARRGHVVFASMRDTARAAPLLAAAKEAGLALEVLRLDVTDRAAVDAAIDAVLERSGRLDVVVNNAGVFTVGPVEAHDDTEIAATFDTNVFGVVRVVRAALPAMREQRAGTIVVVGSIAGRVAWPTVGVYAATKGALEALCDALHYELQPFGIRVILIEPGHFATGLPARRVRGFTRDSPYLTIAREFTDFPLAGRTPGDPRRVAETIVVAAENERPRRRYIVGEDAEHWSDLHRRLSDDDFEDVLRATLRFR